MADIMPIRQGVQAPDQQDWWWGQPHPENPIWPPQGTCGPQPCPPCPPRPPSCFSQIAKADACWDQSQALYNLVSKVVMDIFTKNPGIIPPPPPGQGSSLPTGATDGSNAQPGQVGEWVEFTASWNYPATAQNNFPVSLGVLQPGDWDCWVKVGVTTFVTNLQFTLLPVPTGFSNEMGAIIATTAGLEAVDLTGPYARASLSVPTLVPAALTTNNLGSGSGAGTGIVQFSARRAR